jgi:hypothetical protein
MEMGSDIQPISIILVQKLLYTYTYVYSKLPDSICTTYPYHTAISKLQGCTCDYAKGKIENLGGD